MLCGTLHAACVIFWLLFDFDAVLTVFIAAARTAHINHRFPIHVRSCSCELCTYAVHCVYSCSNNTWSTLCSSLLYKTVICSVTYCCYELSNVIINHTCIRMIP